jgi:hypothetical protein
MGVYTSKKMTPDQMPATTLSLECLSCQRQTARGVENFKGQDCWTSRQHYWTWRAIKFPQRCRAAPSSNIKFHSDDARSAEEVFAVAFVTPPGKQMPPCAALLVGMTNYFVETAQGLPSKYAGNFSPKS